MSTSIARTFLSRPLGTCLAFSIATAGFTAAGCGGSSGSAPGPAPQVEPPSGGTPSVPKIVAIAPDGAAAGSTDVRLTVTGKDFDVEGHLRTIVVWSVGGTYTILSPASASASEIDVTIPAALLSSPVVAKVYVQNYDVQSDAPLTQRDPVDFVVTTARPMAFAAVGSMSVPRNGHAATLLDDGEVLLVGGGARAELFDPADSSFVPTGSTTVERNGVAAALLRSGKVLVVGGADPRAEIYDPGSGAFTLTGSMHEYRYGPSATLLADGRVLVAGGTGGTGPGKALASAEVFDAGASMFTDVSPMVSARAQHAAALLQTGEVLVVGGRNGYRPDSADDPPWDPQSAELFDPVAGKFRVSGDMGTTRVDAIATALPDGRVLALGGFGDDLQNAHEQPASPRFAQRYDRPSQQFTGLGVSRMVDRWFTATLLPDGNVLLVGGSRDGQAVDSVRLIDLDAGKLIEVGHLTTPRMRHTATLLDDGRVLVTGGIDAEGNALATGEISSRVQGD